MTRSGTVRFAAVLVTVVWVCLEVWAVGPVMRESDQAALLEGAVELARGTAKGSQNESYNYDKQFLSYWVLAAWFKVRGTMNQEESALVVREGNLLAVMLFALGLIALVGSQRKWSGVQVAVLFCVLFSPVMTFSGMFLSPNMISAAFLLTLVAMLRGSPESEGEPERPPSIGRITLVGVIAWTAVAARQDAILVMPLLALLAVRGESLRSVLTNRLVGAMVVGCLVAIVTGYLLSASHAVMPAPFFVLPTFVAFVGGGLGALLILLLALACKWGCSFSPRRVMTAAAILLPFLFYACVLYTPRHLFLAAFVVLVTVFFDRGRQSWMALHESRLGRVVILLAVLGTLGSWIVGARMTGWKSGRPVVETATLFPSTDGFWSTGANGWFLSRLANGANRPVDHNQRVWTAWSKMDASSFPVGRGAILSSGLVSYGTFHLTWAGRQRARRLEDADYVLFDERTLGKRQRGVNATEGSNRELLVGLLGSGKVEVVGEAMGQRILLWTSAKESRRDPVVSAKLALHGAFGGNDFRLSRWGRDEWRVDELEGHRGFVAGRSRELVMQLRSRVLRTDELEKHESPYDPTPWWVMPVTASELEELDNLPGLKFEDLWVAFGTLPSFMDVRSY